MKTLVSGLLVALLLTAGCKKESKKGGPDTTKNSKNYFKLQVPGSAVQVQQGKASEKVMISIERGEEFTQPVEIEYELPDGITFAPEDLKIAKDEKSVGFLINATTEAALGEHMIKITAEPEEGEEQSMTFKIEVTAKDGEEKTKKTD